METVLIFHEGIDLPDFASFVLLDDETGVEALRSYYRTYLEIAGERGIGLVLDTPTWRANADWGERLGYDAAALADVNRRGVELLEGLRTPELVISGCVGPRGDGYQVGREMSAEEAAAYHAPQIETFAGTGVDLVSAYTLTYMNEAVGIVRAARRAGVPVVISFTVETDGRLPSGRPLGEAVAEVDERTGEGAAYFMVNCAHPTHFADVLEPAPWLDRVRGVRANASRQSHAELDEAEVLDDGDPAALASDYLGLRERIPNLTVVGGCCGTDHRHVAAIADALTR